MAAVSPPCIPVDSEFHRNRAEFMCALFANEYVSACARWAFPCTWVNTSTCVRAYVHIVIRSIGVYTCQDERVGCLRTVGTSPYGTSPYGILPNGIYRTISYRMMSYHMVSYRTVSYRTLSYRMVSYRMVSYRTAPYSTIPYQKVPYRLLPLLNCRKKRSGHNQPSWKRSRRILFEETMSRHL